jgi:hypothetical protein
MYFFVRAAHFAIYTFGIPLVPTVLFLAQMTVALTLLRVIVDAVVDIPATRKLMPEKADAFFRSCLRCRQEGALNRCSL